MTSTHNVSKLKINHRRMQQANYMACCIIIIAVIGYILANHLFVSFLDMSGSRTSQLVSYKISAGDTLWSLASRAANPDEDVRNKIIAIQKLNGISASQALIPGQVIQIPLVKTTEDYRYTFNARK